MLRVGAPVPEAMRLLASRLEDALGTGCDAERGGVRGVPGSMIRWICSLMPSADTPTRFSAAPARPSSNASASSKCSVPR